MLWLGPGYISDKGPTFQIIHTSLLPYTNSATPSAKKSTKDIFWKKKIKNQCRHLKYCTTEGDLVRYWDLTCILWQNKSHISSKQWNGDIKHVFKAILISIYLKLQTHTHKKKQAWIFRKDRKWLHQDWRFNFCLSDVNIQDSFWFLSDLFWACWKLLSASSSQAVCLTVVIWWL